jgi:biotin synthase
MVNYMTIIEKAVATKALSKDEIVSLLRADDPTLLSVADEVRRQHVGDVVHLRGLIEFSNHCMQNCLYCGIRRDNCHIERYRLSPAEMIDNVELAVSLGYQTIVMQSGEDRGTSLSQLVETIKAIKKHGIVVTLSIGELSTSSYQVLKDAGADRYLLRIETTDQALYAHHSPRMSWANRLRCLQDLRKYGFEVGTGCLVGLPSQTLESLADDILFFTAMKPDMIGIGPFISNPDTPLKDAKNGDYWLALKVMAITRILLPHINIPATTAMETLHPDGRFIALQSGANVLMPNVTLRNYAENYQLYPGKALPDTEPRAYLETIKSKIKNIGREWT